MHRARESQGARSDRSTRVLVALAIGLAIVAAVLAADIALRPASKKPEEPLSRIAHAPGPINSPAPAPSATPTRGTPPPCIAPYDWGTHIVQRADTLYSLGNRYGTDVSTLQQVNCLQGSTILIGQRLYVPGPLAAPTLATPTPLEPAENEPTSTPEPGLSATERASVPVEAPEVVVPIPEVGLGSRPALRVNIPDHYLNILLLGSDLRPQERLPGLGRRNNVWRTDAIIVASVDTEQEVVRLLHIPRDLWADIPGHGYDRINTAVVWGEFTEEGSGPDLVKQTIYRNLGIPIHYYAMASFEGFIDIVNALGGLDVPVTCSLPEFNLEPGIHHMDGLQTALYVKSRETASDFDRGRRQRQVLTALWDQFLTPEIIPKLPQMWATMANSFETDLPLDQVINLAYFGLQLKAQNIRQGGINRGHVKGWTSPGGQMVLRLQEDEAKAFLDEFYAPVERTAEDQKVDKVRVQVLNGSDHFQAEELAAEALRGKGFRVVNMGQADRQDYAETQIRMFKGDPATGEWVADRLNVPASAIHDLTTAPDPPDLSNPIDIKVVLGADYDPCQR
jgi:LCP family protein required for cell wall assembly